MKHLKMIVLGLIAISFSGCTDDLLDIHFGLNVKEVTYTLQPTQQAGDIVLDPMTQPINLDSIATASGANLGKVKSVKIKKLTVIHESPATGNFDILSSGFFTVEATDLPLIHVADFTHTADGSKEMELTPTDADLLEYGKKPMLTIAGKLTTNGPLTEATKVRLRIEFEVTANPLK